MKTTIKIHDTEWFKEHCSAYNRVDTLKPKYNSWLHISTIYWIHRDAYGMNFLEGKVLEVEHDSGNGSGLMCDARYMAEGFWIPNWVIEWVKEEQD